MLPVSGHGGLRPRDRRAQRSVQPGGTIQNGSYGLKMLNLDMKKVSAQALKARLSSAVAEAESGETIIVTRHNQPVAQIGPVRLPHVRRDSRVGTGRLTPAVSRSTKGHYLAVLMDDRGDR